MKSLKKHNPSRELLILDIQQVAKLAEPITPTRNYYRAHGTFTEAQWQAFFPTFKAFLRSAELLPPAEVYLTESEPETDHLLDLELGDTYEQNGKTYKVILKRGSSVTVRPLTWLDYWFNNPLGLG